MDDVLSWFDADDSFFNQVCEFYARKLVQYVDLTATEESSTERERV
jgi:hypothetical protein